MISRLKLPMSIGMRPVVILSNNSGGLSNIESRINASDKFVDMGVKLELRQSSLPSS